MTPSGPNSPGPDFQRVGTAAGTPEPRSRSVVGGLPWAASATEQVLVSTGERAGTDAGESARRRPADNDADPLAAVWQRLRRWWDDAVTHSPAFSASLALHAVLLLILALIGIRGRETRSLRLELSFGPADRAPGSDRPTPDAEEEVAATAVEIKPAAAPVAPPVAAATRPAPTPDPAAMTPAPVVAGPAPRPPSVAAGLAGRDAATRSQWLGDGGGNAATESAVALALEWLARQQRKDGLWSLQGPYVDGSRQENRLAATAMALLALQGAGTTPVEGTHRDAVARAWKALLTLQQADGTFDTGMILEQHQMYAHGQITIALCEALGMTHDPQFDEPARRALAYAIAAQMPDGGWRYQPPRPGGENRGDMSVTGWYLMALKSGEMAGLVVPPETYERLAAFLDGVFVSPEKGYGYQISPGQKFFDFRPALTAEALLCRQYLGWRRDDPRLVSGVELLLREAPIDFDYRRKNVYAWYYQTQVCHHIGGAAWDAWNRRMQEQLLPAQVESGRERGSWDPANDQWGHVGGRLFMTTLCTCMLEVYYRHLPLYRGP